MGAFLNATLGNACELILGLFSVFRHLDALVKASLTGR
jgi:Ca2+/H+ antiporter